MLLCSSSRFGKIFALIIELRGRCVHGQEAAVDLPGEVAHEVGLGLALCGASREVDLGGFVPVHARDDSSVQRRVGLAVAAAVESEARDLSGGGRDGVGAAERGEGSLAVEPVRVVAGGEQERGGGVGSHPGQRDEGRRGRLCQVGKVLTKVLGLGPQGQGSAGQQAKGVLRRRQRGGGLTGAQGRTALQQRHHSGPFRDSRSSQGSVTSTALSWLTACVWALTAESRVSFRIRMTSTWSSPSFGVAVAVPASTALAAASASMGSDLPLRCRVARSGRLTSMTRLPEWRR